MLLCIILNCCFCYLFVVFVYLACGLMLVVELSLSFCRTTILRYAWQPLGDVPGLVTDIDYERGGWKCSSVSVIQVQQVRKWEVIPRM